VLGFALGLVADLFVQTPFGLSALTYAIVGFAVGALQSGIVRSAWWILPVTALVASFAGVVGYALLGALIGQPYAMSVHLLAVAGGVGAMNAVLAAPVARAMAWALAARTQGAYAR
jgi:rod shape-determining protein MreD